VNKRAAEASQVQIMWGRYRQRWTLLDESQVST